MSQQLNIFRFIKQKNRFKKLLKEIINLKKYIDSVLTFHVISFNDIHLAFFKFLFEPKFWIFRLTWSIAKN